MHTTGRIRTSDKDLGGAFALAPRLAVTANHCVRDRDAASLLFAIEGREIAVDEVEGDERLDVALLRLAQDAPGMLSASQAWRDAGWRVESQPRENDPLLTGTIQHPRWEITNRVGAKVHAIQMSVDQELEWYAGYSGCPVTSPPGAPAVVGLLVEQLLVRAPALPGQSPRASNVLYAVAIEDVVARFGLGAEVAVAEQPPASAATPTESAIAERVSGLRVSTAVDHWRNRQELLVELRRLLIDGTHRVISIVGRRGIGKSAVVAKVLSEFEHADSGRDPHEELSPLVYLSSRTGGGLTLSAVYQAVSSVWDPATAERLAHRWQSGGTNSLADLWEQLRDRRPVIVLDNLDDLQRPMTHELSDPELDALLDSACRTTSEPTIVTTSQHPLTLPSDLAGHIHVLELVNGLERDDAIALIRLSATRGAERLAVISDARLADAAERVDGRPRGLQKLALVLDRRPSLIDRLLASDAMPEQVLATLVSTTYGSMSRNDQLVMQLLALAAAPLNGNEVVQLLQGLLDRSSVEAAIDRLVDAGEVSEHVDTALLELHPLDGDHVRGRLVADDRERQVMLDQRLAAWWATKRKPVERWLTLDDAVPSKRQYVHLWRAGEHSDALAVMSEASELLSRRGESTVVAAAVHAADEQLDPADELARFHARMCEARVEFFVGSLDASMDALRTAHDLALRVGALDAITEVELWIGSVHRHMNEPAAAIQVLERIADAAPTTRVTRVEREFALFDLGLSLLYLNDLERAAQVADRLEALIEPEDSPRIHAYCSNLRALAAIASQDYDAADAAATAAIKYYEQTAYSDTRGYVANVKGIALLARGDVPGAVAVLEDAVALASGYHLDRMQGLCATNLAWALLGAREYAAATLAAEQAADRLTSAGVEIAPAARALADAIRSGRGGEIHAVKAALARASELALGNPDIYLPSGPFLDDRAAALAADR
jgi:tetratricopeptide (TPR) repeat protein